MNAFEQITEVYANVSKREGHVSLRIHDDANKVIVPMYIALLYGCLQKYYRCAFVFLLMFGRSPSGVG